MRGSERELRLHAMLFKVCIIPIRMRHHLHLAPLKEGQLAVFGAAVKQSLCFRTISNFEFVICN